MLVRETFVPQAAILAKSMRLLVHAKPGAPGGDCLCCSFGIVQLTVIMESSLIVCCRCLHHSRHMPPEGSEEAEQLRWRLVDERPMSGHSGGAYFVCTRKNCNSSAEIQQLKDPEHHESQVRGIRNAVCKTDHLSNAQSDEYLMQSTGMEESLAVLRWCLDSGTSSNVLHIRSIRAMDIEPGSSRPPT